MTEGYYELHVTIEKQDTHMKTDKRNRIIYWIATGLLSLMMLMSAGMYFFNTEEVSQIFVSLGYNTRIVIPLAILKVAGVVTIVSN